MDEKKTGRQQTRNETMKRKRYETANNKNVTIHATNAEKNEITNQTWRKGCGEHKAGRQKGSDE